MATFLTLKTAVTGNLIDTPSFVEDAIPDLINRAYRKAQSKHNFWIMRAEQDYTTTYNTRVLGAVPSDWKEWRGKPYFTEDNGGVHELYLVPELKDARRLWDSDEPSEPEGIVEALPDANGVVNLEV